MIEAVLFWTSVYLGVFCVLYWICGGLFLEAREVWRNAWRIHDDEKKSSASK